MFDKMKQLYDLQKKAKEVQKKLEAMKVERSEGGVKVAVNGVFKVEALEIDPSFLTPDRKAPLENLLKKLFSEAVQEAQKRSAAESQDLLKGLSF
jgi:DNA-binding YbaB/EbfC family protein